MNSDRPGIRRLRSGSGFRYAGPDGRPVRDEATLRRIKSLVIPPAWRDVWIASDPRAHLQATGRDARGRKQYRYHPKWREIRHHTKYDRMAPFARALPRIRTQAARDLRHAALNRGKVVAAVIALLDRAWFRIGNEEYARTNNSFGLTTLRDRHLRIRGSAMRFEFVGKSGVRQSVTLADARLARLLKKCQDLPGQELFQYIDESGQRRRVTSADVNAYLRAAAGSEFTAKDFRTWAGTVLAAEALKMEEAAPTDRGRKSIITRAVEQVARQLGNTPAVCRACYIHPAVLDAYADGSLVRGLSQSSRIAGLRPDERAVLNLLETRQTFPQQLAAAVRHARRRRCGTRQSARKDRATSPLFR